MKDEALTVFKHAESCFHKHFMMVMNYYRYSWTGIGVCYRLQCGICYKIACDYGLP